MTNPVFGLPHLSEDAVAAFADGVLSAAAASRAQRHCAECVECADAVRGQRETAMMLRAAQAPALPSGLLDRLAGLPMSTPLPPPSRGGLPTVLSADGTAMFIAHDARRARDAQVRDQRARDPQAGQPSTGEQAERRAQPAARSMHRRSVLPVTVLASAAAVVAAGTFGGQVSTLAAAADRRAPTGAANVAGSLTGNSNAAPRSPSPLTGAGALLGASRPSTSPTSTTTDQATRPALRPSVQATTSVTLTPVRQRPQRPIAAASAGNATWTRLASEVEADRPAAPLSDQRPSAGLTPTMAGAPVATP